MAMLRSTTQRYGTNTKPRLSEGKWQLHVLAVIKKRWC